MDTYPVLHISVRYVYHDYRQNVSVVVICDGYESSTWLSYPYYHTLYHDYRQNVSVVVICDGYESSIYPDYRQNVSVVVICDGYEGEM